MSAAVLRDDETADLAMMRRILSKFRPGRKITFDTIRAEVEAAQVPNARRGRLMANACVKGWLRPADERPRPSTHPPAKGRRLEVYIVRSVK